MSVMNDDATGPLPTDDPVHGPVGEAARLDHLLIDEPSQPLADLTDPWQSPDAPGTEAYEATTIALKVSDVIDLGTESIAGLEALVIHGQLGDTILLANDQGYAWVRTEHGDIPEGYDIYLATAAAQGGEHGHPVYVVVQQDLTVVLDAA